jgi:dihydroorotase
MEKHDLVLNLHGEVPSSPDSDITDLTAEEAFLPTLMELHQRFPKLRIVLEHCTTAAAIAAVRACGPSVACEWSNKND